MERNRVIKGLKAHRLTSREEAKLTWCIFCILMFPLFAPPSHAASFNLPEKLIYDLTWTGIRAGTASLEIREDGNMIRIISTAHSAKWVSIFYEVDDRVESTLKKDRSSLFIGKPLNYSIKIREGRHKRDKEVIFDENLGKVTYIDRLKNKKKDLPVPPDIFDPLSSFYYLRTCNLKVGSPVFIDIFDTTKVWNVEIQVLQRERLSLPLGTFDTILIKPLLKSEGTFYRKGDILIWLTDDEKHIPVMMQTKVVIGSITAVLVGGNY